MRASRSGSKLETPMALALPSSRSFTISAHASSTGLPWSSGQWIWYRSTVSRPRRRGAHGIGGVPLQAALGEDERPGGGGQSPHGPAHDFLRMPQAVDRRGVDPAHPEVDGAVNGRDREAVVLRAPAERPAAAAGCPGAEADGRDLEAARAERAGGK